MWLLYNNYEHWWSIDFYEWKHIKINYKNLMNWNILVVRGKKTNKYFVSSGERTQIKSMYKNIK
jgi:hypothetical protein